MVELSSSTQTRRYSCLNRQRFSIWTQFSSCLVVCTMRALKATKSTTSASNSHPHPTISTNNLSCTPTRIIGAQHPHNPGHFARICRSPTYKLLLVKNFLVIETLSHSSQWRMRGPRLQPPSMLHWHFVPHIRLHRPRVDGVDCTPLGQFSSPSSGHRFQSSFSPAIDRLSYEPFT
jgi:hypothetical protein